VRKLRAERGLADTTSGRGSARSSRSSVRPVSARRSLGESVALHSTQVRPGIRSAASATKRRSGVTVALRRCAPGSHRSALKELERRPRDEAGRDRQGRCGLARRSVERAARGARPSAEPHVPRSLPRRRPRSVEVLFIATGNQAETIPARSTTRWKSSASTATPRTRGFDRARSPAQASARAHGPSSEEVDVTDEALRTIVAEYTREAGIRNLNASSARRFAKSRRRSRQAT